MVVVFLSLAICDVLLNAESNARKDFFATAAVQYVGEMGWVIKSEMVAFILYSCFVTKSQ